ncbi:polysaccharide biosynthesis C-terminal domain-containing protein [Robertkochia solimangrovi]|uniref:oligosaccharide flippase family protein n=1 Tax=Robertkochia solimangrovi TaxID=2213046 RepID=UPI0011805B51|nr:polysaccharide biosynthesis C-terminal domain-containing protein [Robertkochia solimangrovi]TRZ45352.1 lipopolysaccharide biosynthesis protein [Robertkochia solimangrovi]
MGIVIKQSLKNLIITYAGFVVGAVNTLFLYTHFLSDEYYGLVGYLFSAANIMMPLMAFGVHNTMVKFFSYYKNEEERQKFVTTVVFLPLLVIIPIGLIGLFGYQMITELLSEKNPIVDGYVWTIFVIAFTLAYFEIFYSWTRVHMKTVYGNFLKEVYPRVIASILLILVYFKILDFDGFVVAFTLSYVLRLFLMMISAVLIKRPRFNLGLPSNFNSVFRYGIVMILAGSVSVILLDIDKVMIGNYKEIENVAYYSVAVYIAIVIAVPSRALLQITTPMTSELMNNRNYKELLDLYRKSSLNLFIVGGLIFLLIMLNIHELYEMIPESYKGGLLVVFLIAVAKLSDNLTGINNAILFNSDFYRMVLMFGIFLAVITVVLNMIFIPIWGIYGAAFATMLSFLSYNALKLWYVHFKMKMQPFTRATLWIGLLICGMFPLFYFWDFPWHPLLNIILKSALISLIYIFVVYYFGISEELKGLADRYLQKKGPR